MSLPDAAYDKDAEENLKFATMDIRDVTKKLANKAAIELLKYMALNMRKEHFSDPRSFSYNKGIIHCLFRLSEAGVPDIMAIWKKVPKKEKKYWRIIMESDFDEEGPKLIADEAILNKEKHRYVW